MPSVPRQSHVAARRAHGKKPTEALIGLDAFGYLSDALESPTTSSGCARGNQFFERLSLWLMDPALYPITHYIRRVPIGTIHRFTLLQLTCLAVLWLVKASVLGLLFPLFIALLVPVRFAVSRLFRPEHLDALDAEEEPEEEETHWAA